MKREERRTRLPLGVVEEKVYCRYEGEHSQMRGYLVESRVNLTLSWTM